MSFCPWWLFYDGVDPGSYSELQQRQMWCFCLRSLLWQPHSFSAWLEKLFCHEKKKYSCVGENINCVVSKWSKVDPNIAPSLTCIGSCTRHSGSIYWKWSRLQKDPIIILLAPPALVAKWQGKSNKLRRMWWLIIDQAWCLVCLARLWSALWSASDIAQACDCIVCNTSLD